MRHRNLELTVLLSFFVLLLTASGVEGSELRRISEPDEIFRIFRPEADLRVVNVWATWCVPCVAEIGDLRALHDTYGARGVQFVGVSLDDAIPGDRADTVRKVEAFLGRHQVPYRNVYYYGSIPRLQKRLEFEGEIPITMIFDRSGRELFRVQGRLDRKAFARTIDELLKKRRSES